MDDNDHSVDEHEDADTWVDDYGGDDAPHPAERLDDESPREAIGYAERVDEAIQVARKGPWLALSAQIATPAPNVQSSGVCAQCNRSYAIRMLKECPHCQGAKNRRNSDALAKVIRELKAGRLGAEQERQALKQLRELGHPAIPELLASIEARNQVATVKPRSRL
jgi:hypothetical protein